MEKHIFTIESNLEVAKGCYRLELAADSAGYIADGEFVDIAIEGFYLRRPISICDRSAGHIVLLYKVVGDGTLKLSGLEPGTCLDILTGLGKGFDPDACKSHALLVGGGLGAAPLYPLCKELVAQGKKVSVILGFNKAEEVLMEDEFKALTPEVTVVTVDGSKGVKGFPTDAIYSVYDGFDYFYTCGPLIMMKNVCGMVKESGEASLEERMGCGSGFCYGCSCKTLLGTKRICQDGPVFKKEEIIW